MTSEFRLEAQLLAKGLVTGHGGDVLNHVNAIRALVAYLPTEHAAVSSLAHSVCQLPASYGAEPLFDMLLRSMALATAGVSEITGLNASFSRALEELGVELDKTGRFAVRDLYEVWLCQPWKVAPNGVSSLLFGQVISELRTTCGELENAEVKSVGLHMVGVQQQEWAEFGKSSDKIGIIARMLLTAVTLKKLGMTAIARQLTSLTQPALEGVVEQVNTLDKSGKNRIADSEFDNICFIGINGSELLEISKPVGSLCHKLSEAILLPLENGTNRYDGDYRRSALRLAALEPILDEDARKIVREEFAIIPKLEAVLDLREVLRNSAHYASHLREALDGFGFEYGAMSITEISDFIGRISYSPRGHIVQSPVETLATLQGDCKAVTALVAHLLLLSGVDADLCIYLGQQGFIQQDNHVFIESVDRLSGKRLPIENMLDTERNERLVIRYPLRLFVTNSKSEVANDLAMAAAAVRI